MNDYGHAALNMLAVAAFLLFIFLIALWYEKKTHPEEQYYDNLDRDKKKSSDPDES